MPHETVVALLTAAHGVEQRMESALAAEGLSLAKLGAMTHLAEATQPLTLGELAEQVRCVRSNVTQLVDRLEADGLVQRVQDASDRRVVRAELTPRGRELQRVGAKAVGEVEANLFGQLDPAETERLHKALRSIG